MKELSNRLNAALAQTTKLEVRLKEKTELCVEKDAQIAAVLEEGEQLSIRQAEQERQIRTLRQTTREAQHAAERATAELDEVRAQLDLSRAEHQQRESAAAGQHDMILAEATSGKAELESLRARVASLSDEKQVLSLAQDAAEARERVALDALREVQAENARLLEVGRWRDEGLTHQLGELSARTDAAEAHASELASAVAQATKPLLRQVTSLQQQQTALQQAAAASEATLRGKLALAEAAAEATNLKLREAQAALLTAREREAALGVQIEQLVEEKAGLETAAAAAEVAASERHAAVRQEVAECERKLAQATDAAYSARQSEAATAVRVPPEVDTASCPGSQVDVLTCLATRAHCCALPGRN
jgi:chromosome segregation ATPase